MYAQCLNDTLASYLFGDVAIFVNVVEVKGPVEFLRDRAPEQHRQADDKVLEADGAVSVDVEGVEKEVSIGGCIWVTNGEQKCTFQHRSQTEKNWIATSGRRGRG